MGAAIRIACAILALALAPTAAGSATLESAYVVLGGEGMLARAILDNAGQCPSITVDGAFKPMTIRARADAHPAFPILVCEALLPADANSASIEGRALPLPKPDLRAIAVFGDTGCRLKAFDKAAKKSEHDHHDTGQFQDCNELSKWPFSRLSKAVVARKPDLVIHVGDYLYRESPCPPGDRGCEGSPFGDNWQSWKRDFFLPAAALLAAAPWVMARGNHEICDRAGVGFFRFLGPTLVQDETPPACTDLAPPYAISLAGKSFIVMDSSNADDSCGDDTCSAPYAAQFAGLKPMPGTVFISHRPVWGIGGRFTLSRTLQQALKAWGGKLPDGIGLALAGHMHVFQILSFDDRRSPQLIVGTGGTSLDRKITRRLAGNKIGGTTVRYGRVERAWGFVMLTPHRNGTDWTATFVTSHGKAKFACNLQRMQASCGRGRAVAR